MDDALLFFLGALTRHMCVRIGYHLVNTHIHITHEAGFTTDHYFSRFVNSVSAANFVMSILGVATSISSWAPFAVVCI